MSPAPLLSSASGRGSYRGMLSRWDTALYREAYDPIHPPGTIEEYLPKSKHLGKVDPSTIKKEVKQISQAEKDRRKRVEEIPSLDQCLNLYDFEVSSPLHAPISRNR